MLTVAAIAIALGIIAFIFAGMQKFKAGRLAKAPFVKTADVSARGQTVAGPRGEISVEGQVQCPQYMLSPVTQTPCLYYELEVEGTWKEGDTKRSKKYVEQKQAAPFYLNDGSGPVQILADKGGDFDPLEKTFTETKKEGFFADLKAVAGRGQPIMFGAYAFQNQATDAREGAVSKADTFTCTERVLKPQSKLFACGKVHGNAIGAPGFVSMILSSKSRDELLGSSAKNAKMALIGGIAATAVGAILGIVGTVMAPAPSASTKVTTTTAALSPTASGQAQAKEANAIKATCNNKTQNKCTEYTQDAFLLGEDSVKELCSIAGGTYSTTACPAAEIGSCDLGGAQTIKYYKGAPSQLTPKAAEENCKEIYAGKWAKK